MSSRREFLARTAGLGAVALGTPAPALWHRAAIAAEPRRGLPILVVVELNGGNDGLNTVVPRGDDFYMKARPTLRVDPKTVLALDDRVGLHPALADLHRLWGRGELAVVQGVGYPSPNRSHFRAMEIWHTGVVGPAPVAGWLGRAADVEPALGPCHVGAEATPLAVRGRKVIAPSIVRLADYRLGPGATLPDRAASDDDLACVIQRRIDEVRARAVRLEAVAHDLPKNPAASLEERLATIRVLIEHDPALRVFYTAQGGFDTHAGQQFAHQELLRTVAAAVARFLSDLRAGGLGDRVVVLLFSEFGRRVRENAQRGTDHGTAGPVFLAGTPVRGGLLGPAPDLADLDDGDLRFAIDFRDVYATLLRRWLDVDPAPILGRRADALPLL
jgi:uncharacterized protein (DUF1501 family)